MRKIFIVNLNGELEFIKEKVKITLLVIQKKNMEKKKIYYYVVVIGVIQNK